MKMDMPEDLIDNQSVSEQTPEAAATASTVERADLSALERRRSHREPHAARAWLSSQSGRTNAHEEHVIVNDLSLHGVGFVAKTQLHKGAVYWMVLGSGQLHLSSRIRVASCRARDEGGFSVGAEFF
jgi:hypothetical protein